MHDACEMAAKSLHVNFLFLENKDIPADSWRKWQNTNEMDSKNLAKTGQNYMKIQMNPRSFLNEFESEGK